jgi:FtsZ-interacting cell division protein ZipA
MDDEAIDLFWGRIDNAWSEFGRSGFDSAISQAYSNTASTIMRVSTTGNDVLKWLLIVILAAVILGWVLRMRKEKNRREKERAEETERILNTPVEKFGDNSDELIGKYKDKTDAEKAAEKAQAEKEAAEKAAKDAAAAADAADDARIKAEMEAAEKAAAAEIAAEKAAAEKAAAEAQREADIAAKVGSSEPMNGEDPMLKTFADAETDDLINKYKDPQ